MIKPIRWEASYETLKLEFSVDIDKKCVQLFNPDKGTKDFMFRSIERLRQFSVLFDEIYTFCDMEKEKVMIGKALTGKPKPYLPLTNDELLK